MPFSWLSKRRRRRLLAQPFPADWVPYVERVAAKRGLTPEQVAHLRDLARVFIAEKYWEGCAGLELTDEIRVTIAAAACLLILELDHSYYQGVKTILVYPAAYRHPRSNLGSDTGVVAEDVGVSGEAWKGGPVILSWDSVHHDARNPDDGRNLVLHEFAHKLDLLDGYADGLPPAKGRDQHAAWQRIVDQEYARHQKRVRADRKTFLGSYAATNPAEFFAVATERFFESPQAFERKHPELFELLAAFYRQRPQ